MTGDSQNGQQGSSRRAGRGFAGMDESRQREIASKGGKAAHAKGTAHEFTPDEARRAGRKGGDVVSQNREHMAMIGREGGQARGARHRMNREITAQNGNGIGVQGSQQSVSDGDSLRLDDDSRLGNMDESRSYDDDNKSNG
jgi:general stress protein YciG